MTGYVRKDTTNNIADGNVINAADLDAEFDGVQDAFNASTGHNHDGTTGEGAPITALGPTQDVTISASLLAPKTTNTVDIGSSSLKFKDLFLAGNGSIGGTLAVTGVATLTANPVLSGGTANGVAYLNGSKVVTSGSALTFDGTNLGVGIASPGTKVDVAGAVRSSVSGGTPIFYLSNGTTQHSIQNNSGSLAFYNDGTRGMDLTSTGLGIGTSSPSFALDISQVAPRIRQVATTGTNSSLVQLVNTGGTAYFGLDNSSGGLSAAYALNVFHGGAYPIVFSTSGSERMRLDSSGNLGLGVTPSAWSTAGNIQLPSLTLAGQDYSIGSNYYQSGGSRYISTARSCRLSFYDGQFAFLQAPSGTAGTVMSATQAMTLDASGRLGIGETSPSNRLVVGSVSDASNFLRINSSTVQTVFGSDASGGYVGTDNSYALRLFTNNTERARIDSSGNFGLGVTPSAWSAFKAFEIASVGNSLWSAGSNDLRLATNHVYNGGNKYTVNGYAAQYIQTAGQHQFYTAASGTAGNAITFTQAMTLDASGNLGIGTTTPYSKLDLGSYGSNSQLSWHQDSTTSYGTFAIQNSSAAVGLMAGLKMGSSSNSFASSISGLWAKSAILLDYGNIKFFTNTADTVSYGTTYTPTERARIDSSGNLLVGTTSFGSTAVGFGISGDISSSSRGACISIINSSVNGNTTYEAYSLSASAYRFYVGMGGTVYATSTTITAISDQRLKENIRDLDEGLATVMALKPRKFDWKSGKGADIKNARGFIAQEFETVLPDMIETWRDPAPEGEEPYKAINANLIPTLVKAIQELKAEFDAYKASHP